MLRKTRKMAAFTLLECLISLIVLSGSVLVFDGLTKILSQEIQWQETNCQKDWLLFSEQLLAEWQGVELIKVEQNRIYVNKNGQNLAFGQSKQDDFRKTNEKGQGYQPMLYGIAQSNVGQDGQMVRPKVTMKDGLERSLIYDFTETP
ncbi:competence protein ComGF [Streptococcus sp. X16XC17]|uniref:competence type IV pilus minor pilin ComGF n=1 Tax=unclassified Streptococcus TaxID=2608887 RepID=UPI00066FB943|nr:MULTISPECIES: competence type IV pilus minor pilin ComGF [unclassified Streptococcus]TCD45513.1 competence protein ComGF [Streptococcus sp. X16XC17]